MITHITAFLWVAYVIFDTDHFQIILLFDHIRKKIYFREKRTGDTDARNIIYIFQQSRDLEYYVPASGVSA